MRGRLRPALPITAVTNVMSLKVSSITRSLFQLQICSDHMQNYKIKPKVTVIICFILVCSWKKERRGFEPPADLTEQRERKAPMHPTRMLLLDQSTEYNIATSAGPLPFLFSRFTERNRIEFLLPNVTRFDKA